MSYSKSEAGEGKGVERGKQLGFAITRTVCCRERVKGKEPKYY